MGSDGKNVLAVAVLFGGAIALVVGSRRAHAQVDRGNPAPPSIDPPVPPQRPTSSVHWPSPSSLPGWLSSLAPYIPAGPDDARPPGADVWARAMAAGCAAHGIQPAYAAKWINMESGGNPCGVGYPAAHGPDGNPKEMGIAQFYNPDDLQALGLTGRELRAYCVPGDKHSVIFKKKQVLGFSQDMTRSLTPAEIQQQADGAVGLIARSMTSATHDLTAARASAAWSPRHRNYWAMVKLQHGLPQVSRVGFAAVTKMLGRSPTGWAEFRHGVDRIKLDPATERDYRSYIPAIMENAERCAEAFTEEEAVV